MHAGKEVIHTEGRRVGHAAAKATRAESTSLTRERHDSAVPTVLAADAQKAVHEDATAKVRLELVKHEGGQLAASRFQIRQKRRPVLLYRSIRQGRFRTMALVRAQARGRVSVATRCWLSGKHQLELSATARS